MTRLALLALPLLACTVRVADACAELLDDPRELVAVEIEIKNHRDTAVLLQVACGPDYLSVLGDALRWPGIWCAGTCEDNVCGTCGGCYQGRHVRLEPGGTFKSSWPGKIYDTVTPAETCVPEFGCGGDTCVVSRPLPATLTAQVQAVSLAACEAAAETADHCICVPDPDGTCEAQGPELAPDLTASTTFAAAATRVVVTFEP